MTQSDARLGAQPGLRDRLIGVLRGNDVDGHHTIPALRLYPHQWNWDSAFIALGWLEFDQDRAWREMESLMAGQDRTDGLVAHIAFDARAQGYEPGPALWSGRTGGDGRAISDISQPAFAGTALRMMLERTGDTDRARPLAVSIQRWHDFLLDVRSPDPTGEPVLVHPWESGRDNSVEWDVPLSAVVPTTRVITRRDTDVVAAHQRPAERDYARFHGLIDCHAALGWDQRRMARESSFRVHDTLFSSILAAACDDLSTVARACGQDAIADRAAGQQQRLADALNARRDADGIAWVIDCATGTEMRRMTVAVPLQLLQPGLPDHARDGLRQRAVAGSLVTGYGLSSTAPDDPSFDPFNYWRGPVWGNTNWLLALGLEQHGFDEDAALLRRQVIGMLEHGCPEYIHPRTGEGMGGQQFSWTAALALNCLGREAGSAA